jgi:hypothetical protein
LCHREDFDPDKFENKAALGLTSLEEINSVTID